MARVTVEDCIETVSDRFDLVLLAARRAKQIATGGELTVDRDNDKDSVVSLREIAGGTVCADALTEDLIYSFSKRRFQEPRLEAATEEADATEEVVADEEIQEVFADDAQNIAVDAEAASAEDAPAAGMSFGDDDVEVED